MNVSVAREGERLRPLSGPGDLKEVGEGFLIAVSGLPGPRDSGLWAPALGGAVLRGAMVRRSS